MTAEPRPPPPDQGVGSPSLPPPASYEAAVERLEAIIARLDSNQAGLRETLALCREGKLLIEYAAGELEAVDRGLEELQLTELIQRLEPSR